MKRILITGASRGIGFETAKFLSDAGHTVFATARTTQKLENLKNSCRNEITCITADLQSQTNISQLISQCGKLDIIIHNAGALINKPFTELQDQDWQSMLDINLMSGVHLIKEALPNLNTDAHIVLISSMGGYQGSSKFPGLTAYSVSKGALSILAECLAAELASESVAVNALCLGAVQTEMLEAAFPGLKAPVEANQMGEYLADFAVNAHRFMNGKIIPVSRNDPG